MHNVSNTSNKSSPQERNDWIARLSRAVFDRHFVCLAILIIAASAAAIVWQLNSMTETLIRDTAIRDATAYTEAVAEFRTVYTSEVVNKIKGHGISVTHDYADRDRSIPLPATMTKLLGDRLGKQGAECSTRLFSDYPFPSHASGGPRDDFEKAALKALRENPSEPFFRFEERNGEPVVRYATADLMRESCVQCHNSHPNSPKTDWKTGDVRGVLAVSMPMSSAVTTARAGIQQTLTVFIIAGTAVLTLFAVMIVRLRRHSAQATIANGQLARKTVELTLAKHDLEQFNLELEAKANELTRSRSAALNLMQDMQVARDAAEGAARAKGQFLANMSHEIRTPMTAILGFAETLVDHVSRPESKEAVETIRRNGEHLLNVINDILDLSKLDVGKFQIENLAFSPHELLLDLKKLMQVRAEAKGILWQVELDGPLPTEIQSDPTRLRQILINLIGNGIKFTEVGSVKLIARMVSSGPRSTIAFDVVDTGIGMNEKQQSLLFQPFSQADDSMSRKFGGTGLGLTISKRFAELLGGDIDVKSQPGQGSTFTVTIDAGVAKDTPMTSELCADATEIAVQPTQQTSGTPLEDRKLLLVEDGPDNQRLISFILKKAGASVAMAENGQIAVELALQAVDDDDPFDVILMDMQMPVMDGYTATRKLRERDYAAPIIALTAHAMSTDRQKCLDAGCTDFATKPIDREHLIATVQSHLQPAAANQLC